MLFFPNAGATAQATKHCFLTLASRTRSPQVRDGLTSCGKLSFAASEPGQVTEQPQALQEQATYHPEPPYLVEEPLGKWPEALCTHKAVLVVELPIAVDNALCGGKPGLAALAQGIGQTLRHVARGDRRKRRSALDSRLAEQV